ATDSFHSIRQFCLGYFAERHVDFGLLGMLGRPANSRSSRYRNVRRASPSRCRWSISWKLLTGGDDDEIVKYQ
ncbi:unnamed protein product, partial [Nesidiocoris tenuis]